MKTFASSLSLAQETIFGYNITDDSTLAYVSSLVALETVMPFSNATEMEFAISIADKNTIVMNLHEVEIESEKLKTINHITSHYFYSKRSNLQVVVH